MPNVKKAERDSMITYKKIHAGSETPFKVGSGSEKIFRIHNSEQNWSNRYRTCDGGSLHLSLVVDNDPGTVLKVDEGPVFSPECLPLSTKR
jgi:hypothetical protein